MKKKALTATVLSIFLLGFASFSFADTSISIVISGQSHASLYPCNCPRDPSGGVARRATAIKDIKTKEKNVLVLESGGSFAGGSYDANSQTVGLDKQRTKFYMESLVKMGYDAALISSEEFNFGDDFLKEIMSQCPLNYLSANLKGEFKPYIIKEIAGIKIAVIGITDSQVKNKTKMQYLKTKESLSNIIKNIKDNKEANLIIVLSYLDSKGIVQLLEEVMGIDVLVSANNPFKQAKVQEINGTILVLPAWEIRELTKLNLTMSSSDSGKEDNIELTLEEGIARNEENKNLISVEAEHINLGQDLKDDPEIASIIPRCFKDSDCVNPGYISKCENPATKDSLCVFSEIKTVNLTVIKPKSCKTCDTDAAITKINEVLPNTKVKYLNEEDKQAKKLVQELNIRVLPAYLIEQSSIEEDVVSRVSQIAFKKGKYYVIDPGFTGVSYFLNRKKIPNRLDVFFDITTPDMVKILDVLQSLKNKKPDVDIHLNFLAIEDTKEGIISKSGRYEVEEFLRSACIKKYYPDRLWYYLSCRISDIESSWWDDCVAKFGMDAGKIKGCAQTQEGKMLLKDLIKLTQELEIVFGPTFLINNQEILSSQGVPSEEELERLFK